MSEPVDLHFADEGVGVELEGHGPVAPSQGGGLGERGNLGRATEELVPAAAEMLSIVQAVAHLPIAEERASGERVARIAREVDLDVAGDHHLRLDLVVARGQRRPGQVDDQVAEPGGERSFGEEAGSVVGDGVERAPEEDGGRHRWTADCIPRRWRGQRRPIVYVPLPLVDLPGARVPRVSGRTGPPATDAKSRSEADRRGTTTAR